jgi:hypothetical protein
MAIAAAIAPNISKSLIMKNIDAYFTLDLLMGPYRPTGPAATMLLKLRAAKEIGIVMPPMLLVMSDKVLE